MILWIWWTALLLTAFRVLQFAVLRLLLLHGIQVRAFYTVVRCTDYAAKPPVGKWEEWQTVATPQSLHVVLRP